MVKSLEKNNHVPTAREAAVASSSSPAWLVSRLIGGGEGEGGGKGPGGVSPYALASALVYFLHRLPEPLLTYRRREAFLSCEVGFGFGYGFYFVLV